MFGPPAPRPFDPGHLRLGTDLRRAGIDPGVAGWHRVRRGVWIERDVWLGLSSEQCHAAVVHAAALTFTSEVPAVFCATSAAALLGLPRITPWPTGVEILADADPDRRRRSRGGSHSVCRRHHPCAVTTSVAGLNLTPAARVVVDLARFDLPENALAAADQALRLELCTRADLAREVAALDTRARGVSAARLILDLADGRAMSAGESLSRLQMFRLNLPRPELQIEFRDSAGRIGFTDFCWRHRPSRPLVGEFDGRLKYKVADGASPGEAGETVWQEKRREDRLRKQADVVRWTYDVARDKFRLGAHLAEYGIRPVARNLWFDLASA